MKQTYHLVAELELWDTAISKARKVTIAKIDEFESHVSAMNYLDTLIISKVDELRKNGYDPKVIERYVKLYKI